MPPANLVSGLMCRQFIFAPYYYFGLCFCHAFPPEEAQVGLCVGCCGAQVAEYELQGPWRPSQCLLVSQGRSRAHRRKCGPKLFLPPAVKVPCHLPSTIQTVVVHDLSRTRRETG